MSDCNVRFVYSDRLASLFVETLTLRQKSAARAACDDIIRGSVGVQ
jgi:hypothetical protein